MAISVELKGERDLMERPCEFYVARVLVSCNRVGGGVAPLPLSHHRAYLLGTTAVSVIFERFVPLGRVNESLFREPFFAHGVLRGRASRFTPPAFSGKCEYPRVMLRNS